MNITIRIPLEKGVGAVTLDVDSETQTAKISIGEVSVIVQKRDLESALSMVIHSDRSPYALMPRPGVIG